MAAAASSSSIKPQLLGANGETKEGAGVEGKRGQASQAGQNGAGGSTPLMRINIGELMRIVQAQHQEAEALNAESQELTLEVVNLRVAQEQLIAGNDDNRKRIEAQNQQLRINEKALKELQKQQCCAATCLIMAGAGGVGYGVTLLAGKSIHMGLTMVVTGTTSMGGGAMAADCNKKC